MMMTVKRPLLACHAFRLVPFAKIIMPGPRSTMHVYVMVV